jgi:rare lipoprotein A
MPSDRPSADDRRGNHLQAKACRGESVPQRTVALTRREPVSSPRRRNFERTETLIARVLANRYLAVALAVGTVALAGPSLAFAATGGGGSGGAGAGPGSGSSSGATPPVTPANVTLTSTGNGITIATNASAFLRGGVSVSGTAPGSDAGDTIEIDELGSTPGAQWAEAALAPVQSGGAFSAAWRAPRTGQFTLRAEIQGTETSQGTQASPAATTAPAVTVTVYRRSIATLYGPGFWGHKTACGQVLRRRTLGLANRTLPCGTEVSVDYDGRTISLPVIDRGPYAHGATWDITMAAARALGMLGTETVGAAALLAAPSDTAAVPSGQ